MADVTNGMRGTGNMPPNQRSGGFKSGIKTAGARVSREDVAAAMKEVHRKVPKTKTVKKTGKKGGVKEKMLRAMAMSKVERSK